MRSQPRRAASQYLKSHCGLIRLEYRATVSPDRGSHAFKVSQSALFRNIPLFEAGPSVPHRLLGAEQEKRAGCGKNGDLHVRQGGSHRTFLALRKLRDNHDNRTRRRRCGSPGSVRELRQETRCVGCAADGPYGGQRVLASQIFPLGGPREAMQASKRGVCLRPGRCPAWQRRTGTWGGCNGPSCCTCESSVIRRTS
jgi:hypothetical protein